MTNNSPLRQSHLVLGGARSGKTAYAMKLATELHLDRVLVATAEASDPEMRERIAAHRVERDGQWTVLEEPIDLVLAIEKTAAPDRVILVDCLTIWLSNLLFQSFDPALQVHRLAQLLERASSPIILVSNELGMGLVPDTALGRSFRDAHGKMNQKIAAACENVTFVAAGLPVQLK